MAFRRDRMSFGVTPVMIALLLCATCTPDAEAGYGRRPIEAILRDARVSIVDATVVEITADGHATISVNEVLKGSPPKVVKGFFMSDSYRTPKDARIKAKKRYILVLKGEDIYENCTFWEILQSFDGELWSYYYRYEPAPGLKDERLPVLFRRRRASPSFGLQETDKKCR